MKKNIYIFLIIVSSIIGIFIFIKDFTFLKNPTIIPAVENNINLVIGETFDNNELQNTYKKRIISQLQDNKIKNYDGLVNAVQTITVYPTKNNSQYLFEKITPGKNYTLNKLVNDTSLLAIKKQNDGQIVFTQPNITLNLFNNSTELNSNKIIKKITPDEISKKDRVLFLKNHFLDLDGKEEVIQIKEIKDQNILSFISSERTILPIKNIERKDIENLQDCGKNLPGKADIQASLSTDSLSGQKSLKLSSSNHSACISKKMQFVPEKNKLYILSFNVKNTSGGKFRFFYSLSASTSTVIKNTKTVDVTNSEWKTYSYILNQPSSEDENINNDLYFPENKSVGINYKSLDNIDSILLYLYSDSDGKNKVSNLFDNIKITEYTPETIFNVSFKNEEPITLIGQLKAESSSTKISLDSDIQNILEKENSSFEEGTWNTLVSDCSKNAPGENKTSHWISNDSFEGTHSLGLESLNHTACESKKIISNIDKNKIYQLSFNYKILKGKYVQYYYALLGDEIQNKTEKFESAQNQWQQSNTLIYPATKNIIGFELFLYSPNKDGKENSLLFDNIIMKELVPSDISNYYLETINSIGERKTTLTFKKVTNNKILLHLENIKKTLISYNEKYSPQWKMRINTNDKNNHVEVSNDDHFLLNSYSNIWLVNAEKLCLNEQGNLRNGCTRNADGSYNMEMIIEFTPQRWFYVGLIISGTTLVGCILYLLYPTMRTMTFYTGRKIKSVAKKVELV